MTDAARVDFWRSAIPFAPFVGAGVPFFGTLLLGGFDDFQWVGQEVSALAAFGILGTICFPLTAYFFADCKYNEAMNVLARSWPTASGVIRSSTIERKITKSAVLWALDVQYTYVVDGRAFRGEALGFAPRFVNDKDLIFRLSEKYPAEAAVTVHYDAASPDMAILETSDDLARGGNWRLWLGFLVPVVVALFMAVRHIQG
jgi:hypothetical protein